ncbi:hypothetical protein DPEC_G00288490 [Dallia pectoralis]|uniref:Uncharacterized protein n=1 Tax=Dallia pectoralis TaxID=75939 RepID=A0ACC2FKI6_DALPE|nr:hypothetical protein DPEC_G00288490 [Dallia pectoralis]
MGYPGAPSSTGAYEPGALLRSVVIDCDRHLLPIGRPNYPGYGDGCAKWNRIQWIWLPVALCTSLEGNQAWLPLASFHRIACTSLQDANELQRRRAAKHEKKADTGVGKLTAFNDRRSQTDTDPRSETRCLNEK